MCNGCITSRRTHKDKYKPPTLDHCYICQKIKPHDSNDDKKALSDNHLKPPKTSTIWPKLGSKSYCPDCFCKEPGYRPLRDTEINKSGY